MAEARIWTVWSVLPCQQTVSAHNWPICDSLRPSSPHRLSTCGPTHFAGWVTVEKGRACTNFTNITRIEVKVDFYWANRFQCLSIFMENDTIFLFGKPVFQASSMRYYRNRPKWDWGFNSTNLESVSVFVIVCIQEQQKILCRLTVYI